MEFHRPSETQTKTDTVVHDPMLKRGVVSARPWGQISVWKIVLSSTSGNDLRIDKTRGNAFMLLFDCITEYDCTSWKSYIDTPGDEKSVNERLRPVNLLSGRRRYQNRRYRKGGQRHGHHPSWVNVAEEYVCSDDCNCSGNGARSEVGGSKKW